MLNERKILRAKKAEDKKIKRQNWCLSLWSLAQSRMQPIVQVRYEPTPITQSEQFEKIARNNVKQARKAQARLKCYTNSQRGNIR